MTFYFFMQLREWITKHRGLSLGIGSIGLLGVILLFIWSRQSVTPSIEGVQTTVMVTTTQIEETTTSESLYYVDIKGAVKNPGVYQLPPESRVQEAIVQAGGITEEGDQEQVNLAQKISDQMVIHVPKKGEAPLIIRNRKCNECFRSCDSSSCSPKSSELRRIRDINRSREEKSRSHFTIPYGTWRVQKY